VCIDYVWMLEYWIVMIFKELGKLRLREAPMTYQVDRAFQLCYQAARTFGYRTGEGDPAGLTVRSDAGTGVLVGIGVGQLGDDSGEVDLPMIEIQQVGNIEAVQLSHQLVVQELRQFQCVAMRLDFDVWYHIFLILRQDSLVEGTALRAAILSTSG
jgi:hypothetical protein